MPATLERLSANEPLLTRTEWQGQEETPAVTTCTYWLVAEGAPFIVQELRPVDSEEDLTHDEAAARQRQFLGSIANLDFED
jgi:hypothetical protein